MDNELKLKLTKILTELGLLKDQVESILKGNDVKPSKRENPKEYEEKQNCHNHCSKLEDLE